MSRILRRPMFRGGPVSSYGTGIAAPLVPGYQGGGQIGGGIIHGKPMADGRYGFQEPLYPKGMDLLKKNVPSSIWDMDSDQALKLAESYRLGSDVDYIPTSNEVAENEASIINEIEPVGEEKELPKSSYEKMMENNQWGEQNRIDKKETITIDDLVESYKKDGNAIEDLIEFSKQENVYIDDDGNKRSRTTGELITEKGKGTEWYPGVGNEQPNVVDPDQKWKDEIARLKGNIAGGTEEPIVDAKTMVAENKELFADLLGIDKARGADISDMLLGFAGAEGDDTWSKFKAFTRDEAKRPGRRQKIEDAAGTLAIQDYIAGKRSKEQIEKLKGIETFKLDEQIKRLYPQADDDWLTAVRKSAGKDDSYSSSKVLKKALAGKFDTPLINPDQTKKDLAEISKDKEDFAIGFTIVTLKDGRKVIIEKTETDIKVRTDLPVF